MNELQLKQVPVRPNYCRCDVCGRKQSVGSKINVLTPDYYTRKKIKLCPLCLRNFLVKAAKEVKNNLELVGGYLGE